MTDLQSLYQEVILDHYRHPRNWGALPDASRRASGHNPLCGDRITVQLTLDGELIRDIRLEGGGCAISVSAASLMGEVVKGQSREQVAALFERFHRLVTGRPIGNGDGPALGKLEVFAGVAQFPARVKCATLAWHAIRAALAGEQTTVRTE